VLKRSEIIELLVAHGATSDRDQLLGGVLLEAVQGGDVQKARELLAQGADSNFKDYSNEGQPLLHIAVTKGDRQMIEVLLAAGADVNGRDSVGQTALYGAVLYKSTDLAKLLLDHKADPNAHDSKGRTLLYLPIERDNPAMLKLLLAYGADPNREATFSGSMTEEQRNLLYWTLMSGHPETAEVLIAHGAKVNGNNNQLLNFAARKYHLYIARFLLAHGADPNAKGAEGWSSPLGSAVQSGYTEMAMLFLDHKADVNIRDSGGYTPLHWALYGGAEAAVEAVKFLLAHGADVNAKNLQNQTPLDLAMIGGSKSEVVNLLQAAGAKPDPQVRMRMDANLLNDALQSGNRQLVEQLLSQKTDVNACDGGRMTPLHQVADPTIAELLLAHGADVSARCPFTFTPFDEDSYLQTPLHFAALYGRDKVVEVFLQHKADVNVRVEVTENQHRIPPGPYAGSLGIFYRYENLQGATPLHFAAYMNNKDVIEVLLLHGAQVDITDSSGRTALHIAALEDGMVGAAEQLLAHKANVNAKDATGLTPLHVAAMRGHPAMVMVLLKHGANINAKDKAGNTAMRLAQRAGRVDMQPNQIAMLPPANASVVDILRRHGAKE